MGENAIGVVCYQKEMLHKGGMNFQETPTFFSKDKRIFVLFFVVKFASDHVKIIGDLFDCLSFKFNIVIILIFILRFNLH